MPLTAKSPTYLHILQNLSLIALSILFAPLCTFIALLSSVISTVTGTTHQIEHQRQCRSNPRSHSPKVILVTGVGMSKGLAIARSFYRAGHTVIGADFEPYFIPVSGRFSKALKHFYRLDKPVENAGSKKYIQSLLAVIKKENVDLWVSCSGVASAVEDGEAAEAVEKLTTCKALQFGVAITELLHEKHSFIDNTKNIGLNVPDTHLITSVDSALMLLHGPVGSSTDDKKQFIMKSVGLDDSIRADMSLLPFSSEKETRRHISTLQPSKTRPFVLQEFVKGPEFCTHSIVVRGKVMAFTCCPSAELLMHYKALPASSEMFKAMLKYTQVYAEKMGEEMTGHFSIDFLLNEASEEKDMMKKIYPIECNPRAHTAVVLFAGDDSIRMAEAYLSVLDSKTTPESEIVIVQAGPGYYWLGHDIVTRAILPFASLLAGRSSVSNLVQSLTEFAEHVLFWRDGTFELWDPWPAWALYCVYWPLVFASCLLTWRKWSRCNVSTTKVFGC